MEKESTFVVLVLACEQLNVKIFRDHIREKSYHPVKDYDELMSYILSQEVNSGRFRKYIPTIIGVVLDFCYKKPVCKSILSDLFWKISHNDPSGVDLLKKVMQEKPEILTDDIKYLLLNAAVSYARPHMVKEILSYDVFKKTYSNFFNRNLESAIYCDNLKTYKYLVKNLQHDLSIDDFLYAVSNTCFDSRRFMEFRQKYNNDLKKPISDTFLGNAILNKNLHLVRYFIDNDLCDLSSLSQNTKKIIARSSNTIFEYIYEKRQDIFVDIIPSIKEDKLKYYYDSFTQESNKYKFLLDVASFYPDRNCKGYEWVEKELKEWDKKLTSMLVEKSKNIVL